MSESAQPAKTLPDFPAEDLIRDAQHWLGVMGLEPVCTAALTEVIRLHAAADAMGVALAPPAQESLAQRWGAPQARLMSLLLRLEPYMRRAPSDAGQHEALRRMIVALSEDLRVVLMALAMHQARQQAAVECIRQGLADSSDFAWLGRLAFQVHGPLAARLGVWQMKWPLEDLAFRLCEPALYKQVAHWLDETRSEREGFIEAMQRRLQGLLLPTGLALEVYGRPKHLYSIYNKMRQKGLAFDRLMDLRAFRVIVADVDACYRVLAELRAHFEPVAGEFDDYIARPKPNGYQSLHMVLLGPEARPFEVQIRTQAMHLQAEFGVAAHWKYKESGGSTARSVTSGSLIYVLTPQAKIIELPTGATPLDFAYRVHTDLGHRCRGAKVDGQIWPLNRPLRSGQTVEILSVKAGGPSRDWLSAGSGMLATARARAKVRAWFNAQDQAAEASAAAQPAEAGHPAPPADAARAAEPAPAARSTGSTGSTGSIGSAERRPVLVVGLDRMLTVFAACCGPSAEDSIGGFVTRSRGVSIHRLGCPEYARLVARYPERVVDAAWAPGGRNAAQTSGRVTMKGPPIKSTQ